MELNDFNFPVISAKMYGNKLELHYESGYLKFVTMDNKFFYLNHPVITRNSILKDPFTGIINCTLCFKTSGRGNRYRLVAESISEYQDDPKPSNLASIYRFLADNGFSVVPHEYENDLNELNEETLKQHCQNIANQTQYSFSGFVITDMAINIKGNSIEYKQKELDIKL